MELFLVMSATKMLHVPYKGPSPALFDLISGRVSAMQTSSAASFPHIRSGRVRVLGVTTAKRVAVLPEVPTIAEAGVPGYEAVQWWGLLVPAGTPGEIIARLHKEAVLIVGRPEIRERFESEGMTVVGSSPQEFGALIRAEIEKWARTARRAGIQPE
jgi:tripartite-type tricarboxylate transporter receptor subunit TctC